MTKFRTMIALATGAAGAAGLLLTPAAGAKERLTGEQQLAKLLEGRVAGEPQSCITTNGSTAFKKIDDTALVYGRGKTIWVNRTQNPESIDRDDVLVIKKFGSANTLCRVDTITLVDQGSRMYSGNLFLSDFVPYTRVEDSS